MALPTDVPVGPGFGTDAGAGLLGMLGGWGGLAGIGGSILGGVIGAGSSRKAANAQRRAAQSAQYYQQQLFNTLFGTQMATAAPFREAGYTALAGLMDMTGLNRGMTGGGAGGAGGIPTIDDLMPMSSAPPRNHKISYDSWVSQRNRYKKELEDPTSPLRQQLAIGQGSSVLANKPAYNWQADPGYQFRLGEGMRALENSAAARGGLLSGGFGRAAIGYGQDMASQEYQNVFNRLSSIAGFGPVGQAGTSSAAFAGAQTGNGAQYVAAQGDATASRYVNTNNAITNSINQLAMLFGQRGG